MLNVYIATLETFNCMQIKLLLFDGKTSSYFIIIMSCHQHGYPWPSLVVYWPPTPPNMPFQSRRKCMFRWRGRAWLTIWDKVKIPRYSHRLMHRKRVTCELHDNYFHSMTIKHAIPKTAEVTHSDGQLWGDIEWAIELLYNSVKTGSQLVWREDAVEKNSIRQKGPSGPPVNEFGDQTSLETRSLETRRGRESQHPAESWAPGPPVSNPGGRERNTDSHKSGEVNMLLFCSVSSSL